MALSHALLVLNSPCFLFQTQRGKKKKKKTTNNTGQLKRKKGDGRGVGINYLVAHNWEGEARPARTVVEIIPD